jgi:hypothetical protein
MQKLPDRNMVLLIDFDDQNNRFSEVKQQIPEYLTDRVFILGVWSNPEKLKQSIGMSLENIGKELAKDCVNSSNDLWGHDLLKHNKSELDRMIKLVKPFLFNER